MILTLLKHALIYVRIIILGYFETVGMTILFNSRQLHAITLFKNMGKKCQSHNRITVRVIELEL